MIIDPTRVLFTLIRIEYSYILLTCIDFGSNIHRFD